ncbi:MAG: hypothetical protein WC030_00535 [Candidatus Paceibacterota bacterium]
MEKDGEFPPPRRYPAIERIVSALAPKLSITFGLVLDGLGVAIIVRHHVRKGLHDWLTHEDKSHA